MLQGVEADPYFPLPHLRVRLVDSWVFLQVGGTGREIDAERDVLR